MTFSMLHDMSPASAIIISIATMLFGGFLFTRLTKLVHLPNVTAYILCGILLGPYVLNIIPPRIIGGMDFLSDIALAFIAFSTGEYFRFEVLKKNGPRVMIITFLEAFLASVIIFLVMYFVLHLNLPFSIVLAALAAATAPASTMMTIRQTHAHGDFVDTLLQVVALDDVIGLIEYSLAVSVALSVMNGGQFSLPQLVRPILLNLAALLLGGVFGAFLQLFMLNKHSTDNRLIICIATLFAFCGICSLLEISPLLGVMLMSTVYINLSDDERLYKQLNYFSPPIMLLFFVRSGLSFDLSALFRSSSETGTTPLLLVGVLYFFFRIVGKYGGAWLGCRLVGKDRKVRNYLGLALIPQAGVAIGLAALGARTLGGSSGQALHTIILASSVLYELIGPACAKLSLYLSGSYGQDLEEITEITPEEKRTPAEELAERIRKIREMTPKSDPLQEAEEAFTEAAEENMEAYWGRRSRRRRY